MQAYLLATSKQLAVRWIVLLTVSALELVAITARYEVPLPASNDANEAASPFLIFKEVWPAGLWIAGGCLLFLSPRLKLVLGDLRGRSAGHRWQFWFAGHAFALAALVAVTELIFTISDNPARFSGVWFAGWFGLASATLLFWLLALAPGHFWWQWFRRENTVLFMGYLLGIGAWMLVKTLSRFETSLLGQSEFWNALGMPTLQLVRSLLGWFYDDLVYEPERFLLGTPSFRVKVSYACSGIEGVSLITLFLALYLWLFRKELRFPQVFWLFPAGIVAIWLANAVRIAMLIAIGASYSPQVALKGFHSQAGWIAFTLIALGAIALSTRMRYFSLAKPDSPIVKSAPSPSAALLVPLLVLMAAAMITSASSYGFDILYPLRVVATALALFYFRKFYYSLGWQWNWQAPVIGAVVFVIWLALEPNAGGNPALLSEGLAELSGGTAAAWLAFRVLGSVVTVPLAEELAFRGYLIRRLIAKDFETVPPGQFTWFSFLITSALFGLLHERWIAGILAGMGYALALYRRGRIGDAVIAHMTTNALIAVLVLTQGKWSLWS